MTTFVSIEGLASYDEVHRLQQVLIDHRVEGTIDDVVLLLEHAPAITVGRSRGAREHVLAPDSIPVFDVERGGDVTWHGPGQLVAYPIVRLTGKRQDLRLHLRSLEEAVIGLLGDWGLAGQRDDRNTGVWLPVDQGTPLKVCSIGIACRRWVTWHGLALNVTTDLTRFATIRPCGFDAGIMTRLADWLDPCPAHALLQDQLVPWLGKTLALQTPWRHVRSSSTDPKEVLQCIAQDDAHD